MGKGRIARPVRHWADFQRVGCLNHWGGIECAIREWRICPGPRRPNLGDCPVSKAAPKPPRKTRRCFKTGEPHPPRPPGVAWVACAAGCAPCFFKKSIRFADITPSVFRRPFPGVLSARSAARGTCGFRGSLGTMGAPLRVGRVWASVARGRWREGGCFQ